MIVCLVVLQRDVWCIGITKDDIFNDNKKGDSLFIGNTTRLSV